MEKDEDEIHKDSKSIASTETDVSCESDNSSVDTPNEDESGDEEALFSTSNSSISLSSYHHHDDEDENSSRSSSSSSSSNESLSIYSENPELERMFQILLVDLWGKSDEGNEDDEKMKDPSHPNTTTTKTKTNLATNALSELVTILDCNTDDFGEKLAAFCQLDGLTAIGRIMKQWPYDASIQANACQILALVSNRETFVVEYSTALREMGGLESIIVAMKNFPKHVTLQRAGCCILSRLCCVAKNMDMAVNQLSVIHVLTEAMIAFPEDLEVQRWGCWALHTLSLWRKNRDAIVEAGGLGLLAYAIGSSNSNNSGSQADAACKETNGSYQKAARTTLTRLAKRKQIFLTMAAKRIKMEESS
jgi:hypothetical protein